MRSRVTRSATNGLADVFAYQASFSKIRAERACAPLASDVVSAIQQLLMSGSGCITQSTRKASMMSASVARAASKALRHFSHS